MHSISWSFESFGFRTLGSEINSLLAILIGKEIAKIDNSFLAILSQNIYWYSSILVCNYSI